MFGSVPSPPYTKTNFLLTGGLNRDAFDGTRPLVPAQPSRSEAVIDFGGAFSKFHIPWHECDRRLTYKTLEFGRLGLGDCEVPRKM
ncbi:hypothetical protein GWI33_006051 [Rhynchophorus ferrugineus]|uniref:Uncharacterized protein n=1 Tax=Rhynchophorus ferrugineus TaxID=354439 RepID=A0A834ISK2_RHYFE|nr:hypothetical protein GWI33_006051 [Rhynchophorus ferrugineus]